MKTRNFGQVKKQKEAARKARQQEKLDRRHSRITPPAEPVPSSEPEQPVADPKPASEL
jgi:hypothetical protein